MPEKELKYGAIIKREALSNSTLESGSGKLILVSKDPFPGYYCSESNPADNRCKELSYYLPVSVLPHTHEDTVCNLSLALARELKVHACPARISLMGKYVGAIRIKNLNKIPVDEIIEFYSSNGLSFFKNVRVNTYLSSIYLNSFFEIIRLGKDIYRNIVSPALYYLLIPEPVEWRIFERVITYQKSKGGFVNYDAATGYWIGKPAFVHFIRIYAKEITMDQMKGIRRDFAENLSAFRDQNVLI
ncbi:MAG: hypothetical protein JW861_08200 [Bacteroidales bacterium]|nr:hypothetical protein [Bacteroidales bacterium]